MRITICLVIAVLAVAGCQRFSGGTPAAGQRYTTAPRDWAARHGYLTGTPRLEVRQRAGEPTTVVVPTTPEMKARP
jgi:hypothetical protein